MRLFEILAVMVFSAVVGVTAGHVLGEEVYGPWLAEFQQAIDTIRSGANIPMPTR